MEMSLGKTPVALASLPFSCYFLWLYSGDGPSDCLLHPVMHNPTSFARGLLSGLHVSWVYCFLAAFSLFPPEYSTHVPALSAAQSPPIPCVSAVVLPADWQRRYLLIEATKVTSWLVWCSQTTLWWRVSWELMENRYGVMTIWNLIKDMMALRLH